MRVEKRDAGNSRGNKSLEKEKSRQKEKKQWQTDTEALLIKKMVSLARGEERRIKTMQVGDEHCNN